MRMSAVGMTIAGVVTLLCVTGCAWYRIDGPDGRRHYPVYAPKPYLLVTNGGQKGTSAQIIYLPDYEKKYVISTGNFLAKADYGFNIRDGWLLTGINDKSDNSGMVSALLAGAGAAIATAAGLDQVPPGGFKLYELRFDQSVLIMNEISVTKKTE